MKFWRRTMWCMTMTLSSAGIALPSGAQEADGEAGTPMALTRLDRAIVVDGVVEPEEWAGVEPLPLVQYWPNYGAPMSERTEIFLAYDDRYLYAAGRFFDSSSGGVRANTLDRDDWNGDDVFELLVDGFNDDQTAMLFTTTPLGVLRDVEILNDAEDQAGRSSTNPAWNTFWEAESRITEEGWFTEMRIPLSSLRFRVENGRVEMGILAGRLVARRNEKHIFPDIRPEFEAAERKPSLARDVVLHDIDRPTPLYLAPYALAGLDRRRDPEVASLGTESSLEVGGELKYGLTEGLTLDLTVNTDFAQVESDAVQVNLNRFNLFFPEQRQFFQERSSIFDFGHGDEGRLFHSRTIGLDESGRPLRILGGARLAGRTGAWDLGVLNMQVDGSGRAPDVNDGVLRLRRDILGNGSTVGGMVTSRFRSDGTRNLALGLDGVLRWSPNDELTLQFAQTEESGRAEAFADRSLGRLLLRRSSIDGLAYFVDLTYSGEDYEPALGFEERDAFAAYKSRLQWSWQPETGTFGRHSLFFTTRYFGRVQDLSLQTALVRLRWTGFFRRGGLFNVALNNEWEDVRRPFALSGEVDIPAGRFFVPSLFMNYNHGSSNALSGTAVLFVQKIFDGYGARFTVEPNWAVSPHLTIGGEATRRHLWFPARDQTLDADIYRLRVRAALDTHLSAETFLQYSRASDQVTANVRLRYRFSEGRDLFLVYDHLRDVDGVPAPFRGLGPSDQRLQVKYVYTFY